MEYFECVCEEIQNNISFKTHLKSCLLLKEKFGDIDYKISIVLKKYNPLLIKNLLLRYIKMIDILCKKTLNNNYQINDQIKNNYNLGNNYINISNNNNNAIINQNSIINNNNPQYYNHYYRPPLNMLDKYDYKRFERPQIVNINNSLISFNNILPLDFQIPFNYQLLFIGPDIKNEQLNKILNYCYSVCLSINSILRDEKLSKNIANYLKESFGNDWFVFISDVNKIYKKDSFDFDLSSTHKNRTMIFIINNKKFHLICC